MIDVSSELILKNNNDIKLIELFREYYQIYYKKIKGFFLFIIILMLVVDKISKLGQNTTICMCVIAKEENRYIREFAEFYKKMGVDKIFLYDNNDITGERFEEVIGDYMDNGFVDIIDYRGLKSPKEKSYNDCYHKKMNLYDWFIFYDVDEFIYLKDFKSLKTFLGDKRFEKCQRVQLNWVFYTDNNLLYYEDKPVQIRFTEKEPNARKSKSGGQQEIKSIVRGNIENINIHCIYAIDSSLYNCDGFGEKKPVKHIITLQPDYENYYIKHYYSKSTEEFIDKIMRTDAYYKDAVGITNFKIHRYFSYSKVTKEKLDLIENRTNLNLSS